MGRPAEGRARRAARAVPAAVLLLCLAALRAAAADALPRHRGYVTDDAGAMGEWAGRTEALCRDIEAKTTAEIAVLTVRTTGPLPAQQYAQEVFDRWKIGKKGKDNGVLVLVAVDDRKMWIATGYGVEGVLPDGKVGEIRDMVMLPAFRQKHYGEGIYLGVSAVGHVLGAGTGTPVAKRRHVKIPLSLLFYALILGFFVVRSLLAGPIGAYRRRGGGWYPGGYAGGGFGGGGFGGGFGGFGGGASGGGGAGGGW